MSIFTNFGIKFKKSSKWEEPTNCIKFISEETRTITPKYTQSGITLQYSIDKGKNWIIITSGEESVSAVEHWFRGKATGTKALFASSTSSNRWVFSGDSTNGVIIKGDASFLLCDELGSAVAPTTVASFCFAYMFYYAPIINAFELKLPATTLADYCYNSMFQSCTSLETAPELPATTLADHCYNSMFQSCTSLETAPELPATTLADHCYNSMFRGCVSLETAPELPATTLADYCYNSMFQSCTSLETAPKLPATTLASGCYASMFQSCTSLETAPELPATTLNDYCYLSMFYSCSALEEAPELPATTLADHCYNSMFRGCSLLEEAPELPATTLASGCYVAMFYGCVSLEKIYLTYPNNDNPNNAFTDWVRNISSTGVLYKKGTAFSSSGNNTYPASWTQVAWV